MNSSTIYNIYTIFIFIMTLGFTACNNKQHQEQKIHKGDYQIWADTIIYEVLISNPDSLNEWEAKKIKNVNHRKLVDDIFYLVYSGKKEAFHYYTNKPLSKKEVKQIEESDEFSRNKVGKLQFKEKWLFDTDSQKLKKEIIDILIAYEIYDESGNIRGYKAGFYLKDF